MVAYDKYKHSEACMKLLPRFYIKKLLWISGTLTRLQSPSLFLEFWRTWRYLDTGDDMYQHIRSCCANFILTYSCPPSPFLETWRFLTNQQMVSLKTLPGVLKDMEVPDEPGDGFIWHVSIIWSCSENFIKIQHQEPCKDSTHPPCPFLESWRRCRLVTNLEIVSYDMYQSYLVAVKISSKSNIRNPVKTLLVLIVPSWSLGGHVGFLTTLRKCHMTCVNPLKMLWKFHQNPT